MMLGMTILPQKGICYVGIDSFYHPYEYSFYPPFTTNNKFHLSI